MTNTLPSPYFDTDTVTVHHGDSLDVLKHLPDQSIDAVVTDPPYGLEFMGKDWDAPWRTSETGRGARVAQERAGELTAKGSGHSTSAGPYLAARVDSTRIAGKPFQDWCELWAVECLRVLKPGGHILAFGGSRTWHRLAAAVEDAGFEIRDSIAWLYGTGFPKSMDVSKAIDKAAGAEREVVGEKVYPGGHVQRSNGTDLGAMNDDGWTPTDGRVETAPATDAARQWEGWGTALKPAFEPIVVGRKPLAGTVAANVLAHGTGAINIAANLVEFSDDADLAAAKAKNPGRADTVTSDVYGADRPQQSVNDDGRFPPNVLLDRSQADAIGRAARVFPAFDYSPEDLAWQARLATLPTFRYEAKAPGHERPEVDGVQHPTVKPLALMRWLVRLVTPPGGVVLDPFAGSGTTGEAAAIEGFRAVLVERDPDYLPLIRARLSKDIQTTLFGDFD